MAHHPPGTVRTDARRAVILLALRKGTPRTLVGPASGINTTTLYDWMRDDPELVEDMKAAEATFVGEMLDKAMEIAGDVKHKDSAGMIQWLLERRAFAFFSRKEILKGGAAAGAGIGDDSDVTFTTTESVESVAAQAEKLAAVARLLTDAGVGEAPNPAGIHAETDEVHSTRTNGTTNGVPAGPKP